MILFENDGMYRRPLDHWDFDHHLGATFQPTPHLICDASQWSASPFSLFSRSAILWITRVQ
jgi:hypothetical protein